MNTTNLYTPAVVAKSMEATKKKKANTSAQFVRGKLNKHVQIIMKGGK